jgi:hypothetical protein
MQRPGPPLKAVMVVVQLGYPRPVGGARSRSAASAVDSAEAFRLVRSLMHHLDFPDTWTPLLDANTMSFDRFNYAADILAQFLPPCSGPGTPGNPWSGCSAQAHDHGHSIYLIKQGIIHNSRLASSSVGTHRDVQVVAELYQETCAFQASPYDI